MVTLVAPSPRKLTDSLSPTCGQSCLTDAVEFAMFQSAANDSMIHAAHDRCEVTLLFSNESGTETLVVTKELHRGRGKVPRVHAVVTDRGRVRHVDGPDGVADVLRELCGIDPANRARTLVKQNDAASIACATPLKLLDFLDVAIGTDKFKAAIALQIAAVERASGKRKLRLEERAKVLDAARRARPAVDAALRIVAERRENNEGWRQLYTCLRLCLR